MKNKLLVFPLLFFTLLAFGQDRAALDSLPRKIRIKKDYLTPSKAAFYSAVLPGLGQIHTRRYWTLPFIYGGLATAGYFYTNQSKAYQRYRSAYKQRIRGDFSDDFTNKIALNSQLIEGMEFHKTNRDLAFLWLVGGYLLNVLDANVGAHLLQFNVDQDLSFKPYFNQENIFADPTVGVALQLTF
ncbi:MAG: DUF5683 domain-containing protein [Flavobacteriaceae bacterium]